MRKRSRIALNEGRTVYLYSAIDQSDDAGYQFPLVIEVDLKTGYAYTRDGLVIGGRELEVDELPRFKPLKWG